MATNRNGQRYGTAYLIVLDRPLNGFHSASADFRSQIAELGWVGLEPTTNALKGR